MQVKDWKASLDFQRADGSNGRMKQGACKGQHEGHLCVLASNGLFGKIKELAATPKFICFNCGRVAEGRDNLCNPMAMDE